MTFTLVSHLREQMASLVRKRADQLMAEETEKERLAIEVKSGMLFGQQGVHITRRKKRELAEPQLQWSRLKHGRFNLHARWRKGRQKTKKKGYAHSRRKKGKNGNVQQLDLPVIRNLVCFDIFLIFDQVANYSRKTRTWSTMMTVS
jgi:hypothetical protein